MTNIELMEKALPTAPLKIAALESCKDLAEKVDQYIVSFRKNSLHDFLDPAIYSSYEADSYLAKNSCPRFGSGEAKGMFGESIRGKDLFIMVDVCNYSLTYTVNGHINHMSPDDHYQDLKRIISASTGKAHRVNVIMPFLYESRQHKRTKRESLDCAMALEELTAMGVSNILTFDAHDPRVQNAIPLNGFDSFNPLYQFIKALFKAEPDLKADKDHLMIISPDEGAMQRAVYFSNVLGVDMGMFYKRRDYSTIRHSKGAKKNLLFVCNFTPIERPEYRVGVPRGKQYRLVLNSDELQYGGTGKARPAVYKAKKQECDGRPYSFGYDLPAYGVAVFEF